MYKWVLLVFFVCLSVSNAERLLIGNPSTKTFTSSTTGPALTFPGNTLLGHRLQLQRSAQSEDTDIDFLDEIGTVRSRIRFGGVNEELSFWTSGTERMRITNGVGAVGIGTSNPLQKLHVEGNILQRGADFCIYNADRAGGPGLHPGRALVHGPGDFLGINWAGDFTGGVRIQGLQTRIDGKLGIGALQTIGVTPNNHGQTTAPTVHVLNGASMDGIQEVLRLERYSDGGADIVQGSAGSIGMYINDNNEGGGEIARISWEHDGVGPVSAEGNGMLKFWTSNVGNADGVPEERMTIRKDGKVGMGTSDPSSRLHVAGRMRIEHDGNALTLVPVSSGGHTLVNFFSKVDPGSDRGFILTQDNSLQFGQAGSFENLRMTLGVFNDFGLAMKDQLWLQGANAIVHNVGAWDSELNTLIGTASMNEVLSQHYEWRIHNERRMFLDREGLDVRQGLHVGVEDRPLNTGFEWTSRQSASSNNWLSVTYGNGLFVAVSDTGTGNRVMTSPDGITWTSRTSASDNDWNGVCYGNGIFVAVSYTGDDQRVMTSLDGITWTSRQSASSNQWLSVTYGNGLFVAVSNTGTGNRVMTSPDGITWTSRTSASDNEWRSVTYGNGLFVAVSTTGTGNRVMTSPDGITWTSRTSAADNAWYAVTYGNGLFVAVSITGTGDRVMTSPDGITWTSQNSAHNTQWTAVVYGDGMFVAVGYSGVGYRVMTSPNGFTWSSRASASDNDWRGIAYANGIFVAVATSGSSNRVMTSGSMVDSFQTLLYVKNGHVGIGTAQSQSELDVAGDIYAKPSIYWLSYGDWLNYGDNYELGGYTKIAGIVYVFGLVRRTDGMQFDGAGTQGLASVIAYLPVGFRPVRREVFSCITSDDRLGRVDVHASGAIDLVWGSSLYVSLTGISFPAAL